MAHAAKPFLALTALKDFWDESAEMIYLGPWCTRYADDKSPETTRKTFARSPWQNPEKLREASAYARALYERLLPQLGDALNTLHSKKHHLRYWRVVVGPWLWFYVAVMYDRYRCLETALVDAPDVGTIGLAESNWNAPTDTLDFIWSQMGDAYNLQIYTKILRGLGHVLPTKPLGAAVNSYRRTVANTSFRNKAKQSARNLYSSVLRRAPVSRCIVAQNTYFSRDFLRELTIKTGLRLLPSIVLPTHLAPRPLKSELRTLLKLSPAGTDGFEKILLASLPNDIPQCFVEGFDIIETQARKQYPSMPAVIFTANDWYYHETFKQWAAVSAETGTCLMGAQHGGNYGIIDFLPAEEHEVSITDRYYSWGWERQDCYAKIMPFPAPKLSGRPMINANNRKKGILLGATSMPRYAFVFRMPPNQFVDYIDWQFRFAAGISGRLRNALRVRLHRDDLGWDLAARWQDRMPDVRIESWETPFIESLDQCRLYVCDHLSTTFVEALAVNKPTLVFWDRENNPLRPAAEPYFEMLRAAGILLHSPEDAANALNTIYDDVELWWNDRVRKNAREAFCEKFARTSPEAAKVWAAEIRSITRIA